MIVDRLQLDGTIPSGPKGIIKLYHGTTKVNADDIRDNGIRLNKCPIGDFGRGFYTSKSWEHAVDVAEQKYYIMSAPKRP